MTKSTETQLETTPSLYPDHELVSVCSSKPFSSLPLFLPSDLHYNPETNEVTATPIIADDDITGTTFSTSSSTSSSSSNSNNSSDDDDTSKQERNEPSSPHLVLVPNAGHAMLEQLQQPISAIACVGPYRTGKSLLLSRFLGNSSTFAMGPTLDGCTRGIWISTSALKDTRTGTFKFLLDCEGLGDPLAGDDASSARIALSCILLSSMFVFNNTSHPDRGSLQFLRYLAAIRHRIPNQNHRHFPSFLWVFRDFFLKLPKRPDNENGDENENGDGDSGKQAYYTLKDYMLERVFTNSGSTRRSSSSSRKSSSSMKNQVEGQVIDSLLNDFTNFDVLSVGYPKRQGDRPMGPEELSMLQDIPWEELDESFRTDIQRVVEHCLHHAVPLQLGKNPSKTNKNDHHSTKSSANQHNAKRWSWNPLHNISSSSSSQTRPQDGYASGKAYAKWCETVVDLVNSDQTIPNLPDLQQQLLQTLADETLAKAIAIFHQELHVFLDTSPVYNHHQTSGDGGMGNTNTNRLQLEGIGIIETSTTVGASSLMIEKDLKGVASKEELVAKAQEILQGLRNDLVTSISSVSILTDCMQNLEATCADETADNTKASILSQCLEETLRRSKASCEALAQALYLPVRTAIRETPTLLTPKEFQEVAIQIQESFRLQARGPAVEGVLQQVLQEQSDADHIFLIKVHESNTKYEVAVELQEQLSKDVQEKEVRVQTLEQDLTATKEQTKKEMERLQAGHTEALAKALDEQKKREEAQLTAFKEEMAKQLAASELELAQELEQRKSELDRFQAEAKTRLETEVSVREERLKQEQQAFETELINLKASADESMAAGLQAAEQKRKTEQERIQQEMELKLKDSEDKMKLQVQKREEELAQMQNELNEQEKAKEELIYKITEAESRISCPNMCCCM
jgi:hypothetical protein